MAMSPFSTPPRPSTPAGFSPTAGLIQGSSPPHLTSHGSPPPSPSLEPHPNASPPVRHTHYLPRHFRNVSAPTVFAQQQLSTYTKAHEHQMERNLNSIAYFIAPMMSASSPAEIWSSDHPCVQMAVRGNKSGFRLFSCFVRLRFPSHSASVLLQGDIGLRTFDFDDTILTAKKLEVYEERFTKLLRDNRVRLQTLTIRRTILCGLPKAALLMIADASIKACTSAVPIRPAPTAAVFIIISALTSLLVTISAQRIWLKLFFNVAPDHKALSMLFSIRYVFCVAKSPLTTKNIDEKARVWDWLSVLAVAC
uniref:Uncharacterized protein n=1 Tax=Mycena chlorophos TaxID=658473 RepID=A0ABQ0LET5_MYCCL|nr:predicted protein [Mycena chlorophos]